MCKVRIRDFEFIDEEFKNGILGKYLNDEEYGLSLISFAVLDRIEGE